jgi:hypothetical protein
MSTQCDMIDANSKSKINEFRPNGHTRRQMPSHTFDTFLEDLWQSSLATLQSLIESTLLLLLAFHENFRDWRGTEHDDA